MQSKLLLTNVNQSSDEIVEQPPVSSLSPSTRAYVVIVFVRLLNQLPQSTMRILMLHGYAQSEKKFEIKTQPLRRYIEEAYASVCPGPIDQVEYTYLTAPMKLDPSDFVGVDAEPSDSCETWGWWLDLDGCRVDLEPSLRTLSAAVESSGPFDAVVGFSQGAALAALFASLCECQARPERRKALQEQGRPTSWTVAQGRLKFAICISGFSLTKEFYAGYYEPRIQTPVVLVAGVLDPVIPLGSTCQMAAVCEDAMLLEHYGTHYVPRFRPVLDKIKDYITAVLTGKEPEDNPARQMEKQLSIPSGMAIMGYEYGQKSAAIGIAAFDDIHGASPRWGTLPEHYIPSDLFHLRSADDDFETSKITPK
ncbi:hypothetical protein PMIN06_008635 [Paraphaeosphaeria minitans]